MLDAQRHLARFGGDAEFLEESAEVGVGDLVEDNESGVDRDAAPLLVDGHRVGVATGTFLPLEKNEVRLLAQLPGAGEA